MSINKHHINRTPEVQQELQHLAPMLSAIPKKERNEVAGYYFNTLGDKVIRRIETESNQPAKGFVASLDAWLQWVLTPRLAMGVTAVFVLALGTAYIVQLNNTNATTTADNMAFADLTNEDLREELAHMDDFDAADYVGMATLARMEDDLSYLNGEINTAELNPYLDNIDEDLILEEWL